MSVFTLDPPSPAYNVGIYGMFRLSHHLRGGVFSFSRSSWLYNLAPCIPSYRGSKIFRKDSHLRIMYYAAMPQMFRLSPVSGSINRPAFILPSRASMDLTAVPTLSPLCWDTSIKVATIPISLSIDMPV